jgi:L-serine/L-threonine ammonia-lyase
MLELACAAAMSPAYTPALRKELFGDGAGEGRRKTVLFVVCGGFNISINDLAFYREHLESGDQDARPILVAGETLAH